MSRSPQERRLYVLGILFAAAPFALALVRTFNSRGDLRLLWMACASVAGMSIVMMLSKGREGTSGTARARAAVAGVVATLLAAATAWLLGATSVPGIVGVASGFGLLCAISTAFHARSGAIRG